MTQNQWINRFLREVEQPAITTIADKVLNESTNTFTTHLENLKSNVIPAVSIDQQEFPDIKWEKKFDSKTENFFLRQIKKELSKMADTPLGKTILKNIYKRTRFGTAPMNRTGGYFNRCLPAIFVQSSLKILKTPHLLLKILAHECTHARNREMSEKLNVFSLPPRLFFMHQMMNELSAYLNEEVVIAQLKDKNATHQSIITDNYVVNLLDKLQDNKYVKDFSERLICLHKNKILQSEKKSFSEEQLIPFAYYFKMCPTLKNPYIISKLNQLYNHHIIRTVQHQNNMLIKDKLNQSR